MPFIPFTQSADGKCFVLWLIFVPTPFWFAYRSLNTVLPFNVCRRAQRCSVVKCFKTSYRQELGPYGNKAGLIGRIEIYLCFNALLFWQVPINNIRRELRGSTKTIQSQSSSQRWLYSNWWFENHCEGPWKKCWINVSFWWLQLSVFSLNFSPCRVTPLKGSVLVDENTAMVETEWKLVLEEI